MVLVVEGMVAQRLMAQMRTYRKVEPVRAVQVHQEFVIAQEGNIDVAGKLVCKAGTWLAATEEGNLYPIPAKAFARMYASEESADAVDAADVARSD